jgi:ATP-dependent HslUV protease ATP-binding subunit HslU
MEQIADNKDAEKKTAAELSVNLTPSEIVEKLDNYIIGQNKAKRFVAVALRNRSRRLKLPEEIREEVAPKNILMIGPTGVGKTEIARRLAKLCGAPFLKVEATKYTEVGYVGRDVESMVRDLMAVGFNMVKAEMQEKLKEKCTPLVEEDLLDLLLPGTSAKKAKAPDTEKPKGNVRFLGNIFGPDSPVQGGVIQISKPPLADEEDKPADGNILGEKRETSVTVNDPWNVTGASQKETTSQGTDTVATQNADGSYSFAANNASSGDAASADATSGESSTREKFRKMLREGKLEDRTVEVTVHTVPSMPDMGMMAGGSMDDFTEGMNNLQQMLSGGATKKKTVTVHEARQILLAENLDRITDNDKVSEEAKRRVEQSGIIFIDEIDKIAVRGGESNGQDVSREGVQRDILPIVEGSDVNTKWGVVNTTHVLFIGAGAFSVASPSDLIPELQGRFPLRVELESLHKEDFKRILTEPKNALVKQYEALLATENVTMKFTDEAIDRMAFLAEDVNSRAENIGARRLHTIMETVLEDISFNADKHAGETVTITREYVDEKLKDIVQNQDLQRYIL